MIREEERRGQMVLCIMRHEEEIKPFRLSMYSAKLILDHIPEIIEYVNKYSVVTSKHLL